MFAESTPPIIVFETGVWTREESRRLIGLLRGEGGSTVFVFWPPGTVALTELTEIARAAKHVESIHENYTLTPLFDACMDRVKRASVLEEVRDKLAGSGRPEDFSETLVAAVSVASQPSSIPEFAAAIGISETTLRSRCRKAGLPTPVDLLGWARSMQIVHDLDNGHGFDPNGTFADKTGKNCSEYVRYHSGKGPHAWLDSGGLDSLIDAFVLALSDGFPGTHRPRVV